MLTRYNMPVLDKYVTSVLLHTGEIAILLGEVAGAFEMTVGDSGMSKPLD